MLLYLYLSPVLYNVLKAFSTTTVTVLSVCGRGSQDVTSPVSSFQLLPHVDMDFRGMYKARISHDAEKGHEPDEKGNLLNFHISGVQWNWFMP